MSLLREADPFSGNLNNIKAEIEFDNSPRQENRGIGYG